MTVLTDRDGHPIEHGDRVAWGVKGGIRTGSICEIDLKLYPIRGDVVRRRVKTTTTTEDKAKRRGHGGWEWTDNVVRLHPAPADNAVYVLMLNTESGDDFEWTFNRKPTEDEVFAIFQRDIPDELGAAQGDPDDAWGTAQSWRIVEQTVETLA